MPYPGLLHSEPLPLQQSTADPYLLRRHSNTVLTQSLWGLWILVCTRFVWALWASLVVWGLILDVILPLLPSCWGFSFAVGRGLSPQSHSSAARPLLLLWCCTLSFKYAIYQISNGYIVISYSHHAVPYIPMNDLLYGWKFVLSDPI